MRRPPLQPGARVRRPGAAGLTLAEMLVALALAGVLSASLFSIVEAQLQVSEMNDQITRAQQTVRAGAGYTESLLRRACSGAPLGAIGVNLPGVPQQVLPCLRVFDGAVVSGGSFTAGSAASLPDAIEIIAGVAPLTTATADPVLTDHPQVTVADGTGVSAGDLVLISDYQQADLFRVSAVTPGSGTAATLQLGALAGPVVSPATPAPAFVAGCAVLKASSVSLYVDATDPRLPMLMLDPDGPVGTGHADAQPLLDGAEDLQVAVAIDQNGDGIFPESAATAGADEWWGNVAGELPLPGPPWNRPGTPDPQPRLVRATLLLRTLSAYPGAAPSPGPYEDRSAYVVPSGAMPRYRALRVLIAPRAWNTAE